MRKHVILAATFALAACGAMPRHNVTQLDRSSTLEFRNGPAGAIVLVDGLEAARLQPRKSTTVIVADGQRSVEVRRGGATLYSRSIFIQDGSRKVIDLTSQ